jgi:carboxyl-terminal processing protease
MWLIPEAWQTIQRHYVDRSAVGGRNLAHGAVAGMVAALGDVGHSVFLTPEMLKQVRQAARGRLHGVGLEVEMKDGRATVVAPLDHSPALQAGIKPGEVIVQVDGQSIEGWPLPEVATRISGPPGTAVALTLTDPGTGQQRTVSVERAEVTVQSVSWRPLPGTSIAHVRIAQFVQNTAQELRESLLQIEQAQVTGLILDLRNNPGGLLEAAVDVASQFLMGGNVLVIRTAQGKLQPVPVVPGSGKLAHLPMVVLLNGGSASGAEIVAGALKDARRATLVGETTFGTGTVLHEFRLSDGSALLLAVQEWLTPNGHSFWHKGIAPDVAVASKEGATLLSPRELGTMSRAQLEASDDVALLRAWELLASPAAAAAPSHRPR